MSRFIWTCAVLMCGLLGTKPAAQSGTGQKPPAPVEPRAARPAELHETVTVTAPATDEAEPTGERRSAIGGDTVGALPLNGRSFISLAPLVAGVALPPGSQLPRINGGRPRTNEYLFDGISVLQPEPGQVPFFPIVEEIQDVAIHTNSPPAEFGRFNGGVVSVTTRSGTDILHGSAFEFFRHEALNARNFFSAPEKPRFRRDQFGGVAGGPIRRHRTFFFLAYQGQQQTIGRTVVSTVPTRLQRQGNFSEVVAGRVPIIYDPATKTPFSDNTIPAVRMDPVALNLLQRYPLPTAEGTSNNFRRTAGEVTDQNQFDIKLNHQRAAGRDQMFARLSYFADRIEPVTPLPDGSGAATAGTAGPQRGRAWALASSYQRGLSSHWLNELRFGDTRRAVHRTAVALPTIQISGYQQLGSPPNTASDFSTRVTELVDSATWMKGRHAVKSGFDFRWERLNVVQPPSPNGLFQFSSLFTDRPGVPNTGSSLASFLLGQVQTFSIDFQAQQIRNRARVQEYFVQDQWTVSDRITLAPGLRYTLNFPSTEEHDQAAVFNLDTQQIEYLGRDGHPRSARELHKLDFGPRLGIVFRATDQTTVSAGYGLVRIEQAGITTPFTTPVFPFLQTATHRALDNVTPAFVLAEGPRVDPIPLTPLAGRGQGVFAVDRHLGSGYVQQGNVAWQHQLGSPMSLEIAYVASKITHLGIPDTNLNQLTVEQLALLSQLLQRVPNPFFGVIPRSSSLGDPTIPLGQLLKPFPAYTTVTLYRNNVGTSFYQGLTAQLQRRLARGFSYSISYTRSRLMDDASSVFDASVLTGPVANYPVADSFDRKRERDYSNGDIPHAFVASAVWTHAGWSLAAIATLQSGMPVAVTQATNFNAFAGFGVQRPNLVAKSELPVSGRDASRWFNTDAFTVAPQFTLGTASRNPVRGPAYRNVDVAVSREMRIGRKAAIVWRGEAFNVLNTPALGNPNTVLGAANFGSITTAGDPRVIQLAAKLSF